MTPKDASRRTVRIGLLGCGNVGAALYRLVEQQAPAIEQRTGVRLVGKHCESGDVLIFDADVPDSLAVGDLVATPVTGAYGHSMASNYNKVPRPAVVFVGDGRSRLV
ncbi:MAG: diaminopimelate decarboxylase, partial [Actinomycetota bacterium]